MLITPEVLLLSSLITLLLFSLYMRATMKGQVTKRKVIMLEREVDDLHSKFRQLRQMTCDNV